MITAAEILQIEAVVDKCSAARSTWCPVPLPMLKRLLAAARVTVPVGDLEAETRAWERRWREWIAEGDQETTRSEMRR